MCGGTAVESAAYRQADCLDHRIERARRTCSPLIQAKASLCRLLHLRGAKQQNDYLTAVFPLADMRFTRRDQRKETRLLVQPDPCCSARSLESYSDLNLIVFMLRNVHHVRPSLHGAQGRQ